MNIAEHIQERVIPIMPCPDIRTQVAFYEALGFEILGLYTSPNPYAALKWNNFEMHFWGNRKTVPSANSTMCYLQVNDVDEVNQIFTAALKKFYGKIPRTGFPRITKVRSLVDDCRFTLTDPGGNTMFIGRKSTENDKFFRKLDNQEYAKRFAVLYDIVYSKEDPDMAEGMLPKYSAFGDNLQGLDKAKYLLLLADIQKSLNKKMDDAELVQLMNDKAENNEDWEKIKKKHLEILKQEPV
jgi:hypothetical protein